MDLDLTLSAAGLSIGDLSARLYAGLDPLETVDLGLVAVAEEEYTLTGLPDEGDDPAGFTLTFEDPPGVGSYRSWGGPTVPEAVIVPLREADAAGQIETAILRDGATAAGVTVAIDELGSGSEPGDYALSGWPDPEAGERWYLRWRTAGISFSRTWDGPAEADPSTPPRTVVRRLLGRYFLEEWLGPALDERRFSPAQCLGYVGSEVSFSPDAADDVFPWTPAEVRSTTGYVLMRLRETDRFDDDLTAGVQLIDGDEVIVSHEYVMFALDFEVALPSKPLGIDPVLAGEAREREVEKLFDGLALLPEGVPVISIRNLARHPTRRRGGSDDRTWRRTFLTVPVRARVRKPHVGAREVLLP